MKECLNEGGAGWRLYSSSPPTHLSSLGHIVSLLPSVPSLVMTILSSLPLSLYCIGIMTVILLSFPIFLSSKG